MLLAEKTLFKNPRGFTIQTGNKGPFTDVATKNKTTEQQEHSDPSILSYGA